MEDTLYNNIEFQKKEWIKGFAVMTGRLHLTNTLNYVTVEQSAIDRDEVAKRLVARTIYDSISRLVYADDLDDKLKHLLYRAFIEGTTVVGGDPREAARDYVKETMDKL